MNIKVNFKNILKGCALSVALLTATSQANAQTVHRIQDGRGLEWIANADGSAHDEGFDFSIGDPRFQGVNKVTPMKIRNNRIILSVPLSINGSISLSADEKFTSLEITKTLRARGITATSGEFGDIDASFGNVTAKTVEARQVKLRVGAFPDYVFAQSYKLMPLEQVEAYIKTNHHLPKVPSAKQVLKEGMSVGQINVLLMEKVEELTLHTIAQHKQIQALLKELEALKNKK